MSDHFSRPKQTIAWAWSAIEELHAELTKFVADQPGEMVNDFDTKPGHRIVKFKFANQLPSTAVRKATEALVNIRHAYDQILYAACATIGATPKKPITFPWAENPVDVRRKLETKGVVPIELWEVIEAQEPYQKGVGYSGGSNGIRRLAKTANSKHTIGIEPIAIPTIVIPPPMSGVLAPGQELSWGMGWDATKKELVLATLPVDFDVSDEYSIGIEVVFDATTAVPGFAVVPALAYFWRRANKFLAEIESKCEEINAARSPGP